MFGLVTFTALTVYGGIRFRTPAELALVVLAGVAVDAGIAAVRGEGAVRGRRRQPPPPTPDLRTIVAVDDQSQPRTDDRVPVTP